MYQVRYAKTKPPSLNIPQKVSATRAKRTKKGSTKMIAHSVSKRSAKAAQQVESTVSLSIAAKLMKFTARQDFTVGNCQVKAGETCFAVQSERRKGRYYIVKFNTERATYVCSCGAGACHHEHVSTVRQYVMDHVVV